MKRLTLGQSLHVIRQGSLNWMAGRPIVVSFEVTDSCNCYCRHCDHGGPRDESRHLPPKEYARYMSVLRPVVVQVSGGEPLLRDDLADVVRQIKQPNRLPFLILVSNWSEMTTVRYLELRQAGVDQFSVSLDFPDERHDDFRQLPGLYRHLASVVPDCARFGFDDISLNTCITSANVACINAAADQAKAWGVNINFSAYSPRRTGCRDYFPTRPDQLQTLRGELSRLRTRIDGRWVTNSLSTLAATERYFETGRAPGCQAGLRWLVVTSDGMLQPCSMQSCRYPLDDQARLVREFTADNACDECYVAIRSSLDKPFGQLLGENVAGFFGFGAPGRS